MAFVGARRDFHVRGKEPRCLALFVEALTRACDVWGGFMNCRARLSERKIESSHADLL